MTGRILFVGPLERVLYLRTVPVLSSLTGAQLAAVAQHARERFFPRGSQLVNPEGVADSVYLVIDGAVEVTRQGRPAPAVGPGETVGLLEVLARVEGGLAASAAEDTQALELDWDAQLNVCEQHFPVLAAFLQYLCRLTLDELRLMETGARFGSGESTGARSGELTLVERALALSRAGTFSPRYPDALVELARHVSQVSFPPGTVVWRRGEPADSLLILTAGRVRHIGDGPAYETVATGTVGLQGVLAGATRRYDILADEACVALRVQQEAFLDILDDHFEMAVELMSSLAATLLGLMAQRRPWNPYVLEAPAGPLETD